MPTNDQYLYVNPNISATDKQPPSASDGDEPPSTDADPPEKGLLSFFVKYAERGSMTGVPYIHQSKHNSVKLIWSCLLLAACGLMTFHLYTLATTYFEYKKQTRVQMSYSSLQFPAVTLCNVNPMRMRKRKLAAFGLNAFVHDISPTAVLTYLSRWDPMLLSDDMDYYSAAEEEFFKDYYGDYDFDYDTFDEVETLVPSERKQYETSNDRENTTDIGTPKERVGNNTNVKSGREGQRGQMRSNNFLDDMDLVGNANSKYEAAVEDFFQENEEDSWETEARLSGFFELEHAFRQLFAWESRSARIVMGHQIHDMLLQCSFAGRTCEARNFTHLLTLHYGNCYTLQYPKFISRRSGPADGLQLKLFVETDEYVPAITSSKGVQVVIHDQGTLPFPSDEGIAVKAGTETIISLKRVEVNRLGEPYDKCTPGESFKEEYGIKYTTNACQKLCLDLMTRRKCGCYDVWHQETNTVLEIPHGMKACMTYEEQMCSLNVSMWFEKENDNCGCYRPCRETTFKKTISSRAWPDPAFANLLAGAACKQKFESPACQELRNKTGIERREEFVKLSIFYEDLNYEELTEEANYEFDQFLSDIGGTIGLWIGLSLLSVFELLHLFASICSYLWLNRNKD